MASVKISMNACEMAKRIDLFVELILNAKILLVHTGAFVSKGSNMLGGRVQVILFVTAQSNHTKLSMQM